LAHAETVPIVVASNASPRVEFGALKLADALRAARVDTEIVRSQSGAGKKIFVSKVYDSDAGREGFMLRTIDNVDLAVVSVDDSGALYGCLELARRIGESGRVPASIHFTDQPAMTLRGTCIGMQKTYILPGRKVYEYPYTPDLFPWFYD